MPIRWFRESFTRFPCATNTTFQRRDFYQGVLRWPVEPASFAGSCDFKMRVAGY
jgi:hypothetical protein